MNLSLSLWAGEKLLLLFCLFCAYSNDEATTTPAKITACNCRWIVDVVRKIIKFMQSKNMFLSGGYCSLILGMEISVFVKILLLKI